MAKIELLSGQTITDIPSIQKILAPIQVQLSFWMIQQNVEILLQQSQLQEEEKETVAKAHDIYFKSLQEKKGYQHRDLIVLHPDIPNLDTLLEKFSRIHTHDDDEVRYIVDGEGIFGFVLPNNTQILLTVEPGEFIHVPKDTEHWFVLTEKKRIKALRYFTTMDGWAPNYTQRAIQF